ncbi:TIGR03083 family protein [Amycolatopsis xylanica]|uniref:TIGR03083 family protein n=1 Tax=Amycolatopsis xylanica TaxID=589385 RepID=A0A1H3QBY5_9PSEU|nr:maleylpyruvate isomerase N-terminal domain-containing protein [Amycolatopsis xylanica]SDZ10631.1 TIGR03083 family protein [Amycolatopsis xylanica]
MPSPISDAQWHAVRVSLKHAGDRFAELVSSRDPDAKATQDWTVADTAAHVAVIAKLYTAQIGAEETPHPLPSLRSTVLTTTVDTVSDLNATALARFTERDTGRIIEQLQADIDVILRISDGLDPEEPLPWLGDSRVPRAGVLAHLVNELLIHGWDIARWRIPPQDAALFVDLFLVGLLRHDPGHLLANDEPPRERRIAVQFRSDHTNPVTLVLHRGKVTVEDPRDDNDVRLRFDPPTLNLMNFHRVSKARAVLTGKIGISGPKPWLLPRFLKTVRLP